VVRNILHSYLFFFFGYIYSSFLFILFIVIVRFLFFYFIGYASCISNSIIPSILISVYRFTLPHLFRCPTDWFAHFPCSIITFFLSYSFTRLSLVHLTFITYTYLFFFVVRYICYLVLYYFYILCYFAASSALHLTLLTSFINIFSSYFIFNMYTHLFLFLLCHMFTFFFFFFLRFAYATRLCYAY